MDMDGMFFFITQLVVQGGSLTVISGVITPINGRT